MANHPANLALRFLLELIALGGIGALGGAPLEGAWRWIGWIGAPVVAATLWGVFRVDGDPKEAPVAVPGAVRLALEAAFFVAATYGFSLTAPLWVPASFGVVVAGHYVVSYDRVRWLIDARARR